MFRRGYALSNRTSQKLTLRLATGRYCIFRVHSEELFLSFQGVCASDTWQNICIQKKNRKSIAHKTTKECYFFFTTCEHISQVCFWFLCFLSVFSYNFPQIQFGSFQVAVSGTTAVWMMSVSLSFMKLRDTTPCFAKLEEMRMKHFEW